MSKKQIWMIAIAAAVLIYSFVKHSQELSNAWSEVCFQSRCVQVEVVQKKEDLLRGLQNRTSLPEKGGMLFIFPKPGEYPMWMKDTRIPLDMIWLDHYQNVIFIAKNLQPCQKDPCPSYGPRQEALYVLEVNSGLADEWRIKLNDWANFKIKELRQEEQ